jgi:hypothetical protein
MIRSCELKFVQLSQPVYVLPVSQICRQTYWLEEGSPNSQVLQSSRSHEAKSGLFSRAYIQCISFNSISWMQ